MERYVSLMDFEREAKTVMTENAKSYINSGANHQLALSENFQKFKNVKLNPRILVNVSSTCTKTTLLNSELEVPFGIAPTAMHCLVHPKGEFNTMKASVNKGSVMVVSTLGTVPFEDLGKIGGSHPKWFQLYITKNREITKTLVRNAEESGYKALVLTVDAPVLGKRESDMKNKFNLPSGYKLENLERFGNEMKMDSSEGSGLLSLFADQVDKTLTWESVTWLKSITKLPVVIKGVQCAEDAALAGKYIYFLFLNFFFHDFYF